MARRGAAAAKGTRRPRKASPRAADGDHDGDAADCGAAGVRPPPKGHGAAAAAAGGFFCCYLLHSLSPRRKGRTYIGFTVNPRRRIRQHNGEIASGAWHTRRGRPWEMVLCIYGFPSNVAALQFEWAWQHPTESLAVRKAAAEFKALGGTGNKIKLAYTMLNLPAWENLNLTVNFFSSKNIKFTAGCPSLPSQMKTVICPMEDLQCDAEAPSSEEDGINDESRSDQGQPGSDLPLGGEQSYQTLEQLPSDEVQPAGEQTRIARFDAEEGEGPIDDSLPMEWGGVVGNAREESDEPRTSPRCPLSPFGDDDGCIAVEDEPEQVSPMLMFGASLDDGLTDEPGHLFHEKGVVDLVTATPVGRTRRRDCVASICPKIIDLTASPIVIQL